MNTQFEDLQQKVRQLPVHERAVLIRTLIDDLDPAGDADVNEMWIAESERRYAGFKDGTITSSPGDEAMARIRSRLK